MSINISSITRVDLQGSDLPQFKLGASSEKPFQIIFRMYNEKLKRIAIFESIAYSGSKFVKVTAPYNAVLVLGSVKLENGIETIAGAYTIFSECCWKC